MRRIKADSNSNSKPNLRGNAASSTGAFGGTRPMFQTVRDRNGVEISRNSHPELEYEHNERLRTGMYGSSMFGAGLNAGLNLSVAEERISLSKHSFNQVFNQTGTGRGQMTFRSSLKDSTR